MNYTSDQAWELSLLMLCVWREARNQTFQAMLGVAWVVRNRANGPVRWWGGPSYSSVILKPFQFSSFNLADPNARLIPQENDPSFQQAQQAAVGAYSATLADPTGGAVSYYSTDIEAPDWAAEMEFTVQIDSFRFYRS